MFTKCMCMKQTATCTKTILIVRKMKYLEEFRLLYGVWIVLDFSICCYTYDSTFLPDIEDQQFMQDCIKTHNYFRSRVNPSSSNMLHMTWDPALAKTAKAWAKKCYFGHNSYLKIPSKVHPIFTPVGENIWTGSLSMFSAKAAIHEWYNEVNDYNFMSHDCAKVCGHYTQVVWAASYKVGCAVHFCRTVSGNLSLSNGAHFVCNYGPAGNLPQQPYNRGGPCSECHDDDKCVHNLCENPERDRLMSHSNWSPDWDISEQEPKTSPKSPLPPYIIPPHHTKTMPTLKPFHFIPTYTTTPIPSHSRCDSYCMAVSILRLLFLLLTFGTVFMLTKQYPEMFIYE